MTALENRLERRVREWQRLAASYRAAQLDCEPSEQEWDLNKENADMLERCASELRSDLAAAKAIKRSQYAPVDPEFKQLNADFRGKQKLPPG
jgi:hypothetical protein